MQIFSAKLGTGVLWSTILACFGVLFFPIIFSLIYKLKPARDKIEERFRKWFIIVFDIFWLSCLIFCYIGAPVSYEIAEDKVIINTRKESIAIPFTEIKDVWLDKEGRYKITWYILKRQGWSVLGLWGNYGHFSTYQHGWVKMYATDMNKIVVLETYIPIIVTPNNHDRFVKVLSERLKINSQR